MQNIDQIYGALRRLVFSGILEDNISRFEVLLLFLSLKQGAIYAVPGLFEPLVIGTIYIYIFLKNHLMKTLTPSLFSLSETFFF